MAEEAVEAGVDLVQWLVGDKVAAGRGDSVCYIGPDGKLLTYGELYQAAGALATILHDGGARPGDRCLVVTDDTVEAVVTVLGLWWCGCVPVPVAPMLTAPELVPVARDCGARLAYLDAPEAVSRGLTAEVDFIRIDPDCVRQAVRRARDGERTTTVEPMRHGDLSEVLVQYTSGSTGSPRGVRHSARGLAAVQTGFGAVVGLEPTDTVLSTAKLSFGYGFGNSLLLTLAAGACAVLRTDPPDVFTFAEAVRSYRPTVVFAVPRLYAGLLELADRWDAAALETVRLAVSAGEQLPDPLARRFTETFGVRLLNGLGATEVLHIVVCGDVREPSDTLGTAVPGVTATVRDEEGHVVPDGQTGRLHISGPSVALGYLDRPLDSAHTFRDGGAYTGDLVLRCGGALRYVSRADDLLNLGGFKVSPFEIESVVRGTHGVVDCAVVAETDDAGLQRAVLYAVGDATSNSSTLRAAITSTVRSRLAPFKRPSRIEVLDRLPVTSNGKLSRSRLRTLGSSDGL